MIEIGTVAMKIAGREASRYCVVVKKIDDNFVIVTGPKILTGVKRRRCNIRHLEELPYKLEIKEDASDEEVLEAWKKSGLYKKLGLKLPAAHEIKEMKEKEKKEEKEEEKKEKKKEKRKTSEEKKN
jgi:large subunit ribosomal protein L14e